MLGSIRSWPVSFATVPDTRARARNDTLQGRPCQLDGGIPPADGRRDPPPIAFGTIDTTLTERLKGRDPAIIKAWLAGQHRDQ